MKHVQNQKQVQGLRLWFTVFFTHTHKLPQAGMGGRSLKPILIKPCQGNRNSKIGFVRFNPLKSKTHPSGTLNKQPRFKVARTQHRQATTERYQGWLDQLYGWRCLSRQKRKKYQGGLPLPSQVHQPNNCFSFIMARSR